MNVEFSFFFYNNKNKEGNGMEIVIFKLSTSAI